MKKRKTLEVKKRELDEQAAAALAAKKSNLQKETPPAPSESEIDMGVFSTKRGNLLEKIYVASAPQGKDFALEIVREWKLMGEETLEFENDKKAFAEKREKFNAEKKGLLWRVSDAEKKLVQEKQVNSNKQKEWEVACERTNKELQSQRDAIVRLSGEKKKISDEAEEERAAHQKR
ncbi:hypothetical protein HanXRQr2_Chr13g0590731 [Helianthus annuus]|uniref:Uncharacterized protein n=1 Tax=Helianthus annuus TaxID=4232 RepID=A0A9K3EHH5_HELAN|nr:hypothetical protein HanXRQr2_Chr13g0590731 [Helianthus annuus]KAJ0497932.1 hypothetical protein HanHA89_Chr13g0516651 [Helianthus annuus]KAJ0849450.1 hypothetical protein HanPSC8_Chr13g0568871 [Helianthus annuus]